MKQYFVFTISCLLLVGCSTWIQPEFTRTEQEIYDAVIDTIQKPTFLPSHAHLIVALDPYVEYRLKWVAMEKHPTNPYLYQLFENHHGSKDIDTTNYFEQNLSIIPKLDTYKIYHSGSYNIKVLANGKSYWMHSASGQIPYKKCRDYFHLENYQPNPFKKDSTQVQISDWAHKQFSCIKFISKEGNKVKALITDNFREEEEHNYRLIGTQDFPLLDNLAILYRWKPTGRIYLSEKGAYLDPIKN